MTVYSYSKEDTDGRGLARALSTLSDQIRAGRRINAGNAVDPTPAPVDIAPSGLQLLAIGRETP